MKYHCIVQAPRGGVEFIEDEIADPHHDEVRVQIQAAGVSFADMLMREGVHPEARRKPLTPGWDIVGVVEKLGDSVTSFKVGDAVAAMPIVGGYAEYICLPESSKLERAAGTCPVKARFHPKVTISVSFNYRD